jgi:hypothetical protein
MKEKAWMYSLEGKRKVYAVKELVYSHKPKMPVDPIQVMQAAEWLYFHPSSPICLIDARLYVLTWLHSLYPKTGKKAVPDLLAKECEKHPGLVSPAFIEEMRKPTHEYPLKGKDALCQAERLISRDLNVFFAKMYRDPADSSHLIILTGGGDFSRAVPEEFLLSHQDTLKTVTVRNDVMYRDVGPLMIEGILYDHYPISEIVRAHEERIKAANAPLSEEEKEFIKEKQKLLAANPTIKEYNRFCRERQAEIDAKKKQKTEEKNNDKEN